jgi:hypothetical protein
MRLSFAIVFVATALGATACGSASGEGQLSKREWTTQANAICARGDRRIHALGSAMTLEEVSRVVGRTSEIFAEQLRALRRLRPPASEQRTVEAFLERVAAQVRGVMSVAAAAASGDSLAADRAGERLPRLAARTDELATALGVHECLSDDG